MEKIYDKRLRNYTKILNVVKQNEYQITNLKVLFFFSTITDILLSFYYFNLVRVGIGACSVTIIIEPLRDYNNFCNEKCFTEKEWMTKTK